MRESHPWIWGVYRIFCTANHMAYIGSSHCDVWRRIITHRGQLTRNKHYIASMQTDWNRYGSEAFIFEFVEQGPIDRRRNGQDGANLAYSVHFREQAYIDLHSPNVYNHVRHVDVWALTRWPGFDPKKDVLGPFQGASFERGEIV